MVNAFSTLIAGGISDVEPNGIFDLPGGGPCPFAHIDFYVDRMVEMFEIDLFVLYGLRM